MRESWSATCIKKKKQTNKQQQQNQKQKITNKQKTHQNKHTSTRLLMEYSYNQRNILAPLGNGSLKKKIWHLGEMHKFCVWLKHIR